MRSKRAFCERRPIACGFSAGMYATEANARIAKSTAQRYRPVRRERNSSMHTVMTAPQTIRYTRVAVSPYSPIRRATPIQKSATKGSDMRLKRS